jgi:hypothetical protein
MSTRPWALALAALACLAPAQPASAFVVEVTTSVAVRDADDHTILEAALQRAVDGVLKDAVSFKPTLIMLTRAVVVGDRLYVRLLVADESGEEAVKNLSPHPQDPPPPTDI